jgi:unsaturated chondroitin disaccharide hydrolase
VASATRLQEGLEAMTRRVVDSAGRVGEGFPHYGDAATGEWTTSPGGDWTGGFWNGMLWLAHARTGEDRFREWAERWTRLLEPRARSETVFRGFLFYYGAALGSILSGNEFAREVGLAGALGLATLYNEKAAAIPLGTEAEEASDPGRRGRGATNVDGVQGAALLFWAARETGEPALHEIGLRHALRHVEWCVRADGSVCQSASFDPESGVLLHRYTHKGLTDESTWARAQAWAMLGYAVDAIWEPERRELLDTAERTADWWIDHVPTDRVAYWDFDVEPGPGVERDTSATAIALAALLKLAELASDAERRTRYRAEAEATAAALLDGYLTEAGILTEGCYNRRIGLATRSELIWGSYYLYEALHVLLDSLDPAKI